MSGGARRGASLRTLLTPFAVSAGLAALGAIATTWRGTASGARPDEPASKKAGPASPAIAESRSEIHALARIEPEAGIVQVGVRPGVRVERVAVEEGDQVPAGAALAVLEGHEQARFQLALAEAQKSSAEFQRALGREKLAVEREREDRLKKDRLEAQEHMLDVSRRRLQAATEIYKTLGQAAQGKVKYDLDMAYFQAEADTIRVQQDLKELQVGQDLIARRRTVEDRQLADDSPDVAVLDRQVELARASLEQLTVHAPSAGRVLEVVARAGEVSAGPLLALGDVSAMVAVAEVDQSDVPEVRPDDPAEAIIQGRKVAGRVTRVARLVGRNALTSLDPRTLQDRRVVAVTVRLDEPGAAAEYVNMEVEVTIAPRSRAGQGGPR